MLYEKLKLGLYTTYENLGFTDSDIDIFTCNSPHLNDQEYPRIDTSLEDLYSKDKKVFGSPTIQIFASNTNQNQNVDDEYSKQSSTFIPTALTLHAILRNQRNKYYYLRSRNAITFICSNNTGYSINIDHNFKRPIQIVDGFQRSPEGVLLSFDLDSSTFAFDGRQVYTLARGKRAMNTKCNYIDPFILKLHRTKLRISKYYLRGFSFMLYEYCKHKPRCDIILDANSSTMWEKTKSLLDCINDHNLEPIKDEDIIDIENEFPSNYHYFQIPELPTLSRCSSPSIMREKLQFYENRRKLLLDKRDHTKHLFYIHSYDLQVCFLLFLKKNEKE